MLIFLLIVLQPLERLALRANDTACAFERSDDQHVRFHFGDHSHFPGLTNLAFSLAMNVTQISNHNVRTPFKTTPAILNARLEQIALGHVSRREPTDQWNHTNGRGIAVQPEPQRMLLVADIKARVPRFK